MAFATYPSLKGRVVFITGGASGIGATLTREFHAQGAKVAFVDLQQQAGDALKAEFSDRCWFSVCDVTDAKALQGAIGAAREALGPVTILINNVANDTRRAAEDTSVEQWRAGLAVNLDPVFIASTAVMPMMRDAGGGVIVNLSSINALLGPPLLANYVAAKGAINAMTKSLAREWGPHRIRVNALSPGWVVTERQLELWLTPQAEADWSKLAALQGRIEPTDIAHAAMFLAADDSRFVTGQNLVVDAGRT